MESGKLPILGLVALLVLSGCAGAKDEPTDTGTDLPTTLPPTSSRSTTQGTTTTSSSTTTGSQHLAHLSASTRDGTAPLAVTFSVKADGAGASKWMLDFGDGQKKDGTSFPGAADHSYATAGTFVAKVTVTYSSGSPAEDSLSIGVLPANSGGPVGYKLNVTTTVQAPLGPVGFGCLRGLDPAVDPTNDALCGPEQAAAMHKQDADTSNGTWFRWFDFPVVAGSTGIAVHAGTHDAQTCAPADPLDAFPCVPDFDIGILDPSGVWQGVGTQAAFEEFAQAAPAPGTWSLVVIYFDGPPNAEVEVQVEVPL